MELGIAANQVNESGYFSTANLKDEREKIIREVTQRRGQKEFREKLLDVYKQRCVVTGCNAQSALEAAHITPYCGMSSNHVSNGLLLRADIHTLFDLNLIGINPKTMTVHIGTTLRGTTYESLEGGLIIVPFDINAGPSAEALTERWNSFQQCEGVV